MNIQSIAGLALFVVASVFASYHFLKKRKEGTFSDSQTRTKLTRKEYLLLQELRKKNPPIQSDDRLPSFKKSGYFLEDITQSVRLLFNELSIPSNEAKRGLKSGDRALLNFIDKDNKAMKMWVEVIAFHQGLYQSELKTDTYSNANLRYGSNVWFHPNHILEINKA